MNENYFYRSGNISVTTTLVKIGEASYSLANVGSVYISREKTGFFWFLSVLFGFFALGAAGYIKNTIDSSGSVSFWDILPFMLCSPLSIFSLYRALKPRFFLTFKTSSSDHRILESRQFSDLGPVKLAIEKAITARG